MSSTSTTVGFSVGEKVKLAFSNRGGEIVKVFKDGSVLVVWEHKNAPQKNVGQERVHGRLLRRAKTPIVESRSLSDELSNPRDIEDPFTQQMLALYGDLMTQDDLIKLFKYQSENAFSQAVCRGSIGFELFKLQKRHGYFAKTLDVAAFILKQRQAAIDSAAVN